MQTPRTLAGKAAVIDAFRRLCVKGTSDLCRAYAERFGALDPESDWDDAVWFMTEFERDALRGRANTVPVNMTEFLRGGKL